jgi:hypothetical protein
MRKMAAAATAKGALKKKSRFVRRGASGSPPFPHLTLEDGVPFDAPEFPLVYDSICAAT